MVCDEVVGGVVKGLLFCYDHEDDHSDDGSDERESDPDTPKPREDEMMKACWGIIMIIAGRGGGECEVTRIIVDHEK